MEIIIQRNIFSTNISDVWLGICLSACRM